MQGIAFDNASALLSLSSPPSRLGNQPDNTNMLFSRSIFSQTRSPSSNGSPHSGQNFGGCVGSAGSQPHLSHLYCGTPAGFGLPHSEQNFPLFTAPQLHVQPSICTSGFFVPHSGQNFPITSAPHCGHFQLPAAGFGSGFLLPQFGQKFPVIPLCPHAQSHPSDTGFWGC